jgi:hypothetical protein
MIEPKHEASLLAEEKSLWAGQMFVIMLITFLLNIKGGYFQFGLVFIKKNNQNLFFLKKETETGSNRPVSVRLRSIILGKKPVFPVWLGFF